MKNGRVIINRNICDNAPECSGIEVCPQGALYWNEANESIEYDSGKCVDCGLCANPDLGGCPVGAILWGEDDEDYEKKLQKVADEKMTIEELEVDRYGATPMSELLEASDLMSFVQNSNSEYVLVEFFNDSSINCLVHSIRIEDIKKCFNSVVYKKVQLADPCEKFPLDDIECLPSLAIFKDGNCIKVINGYFEDNEADRQTFFDLINSSIS